LYSITQYSETVTITGKRIIKLKQMFINWYIALEGCKYNGKMGECDVFYWKKKSDYM